MVRLVYSSMEIERRDLAGIFIKYDNKKICIDILTDINCDYLLYTHNHSNHAPSVELLHDRHVISPFYGIKVHPGDTIKLSSNIVIEIVNAYNITKIVNGSIPHPKGFGVGYVINIDGKVLYHMGDTDLIEEVAVLSNRKINILFAPIGGNTVMTPEEAADAVMLLRPTISIPMHFTDRGFFVKFRDIVQPYTQVILL
ncbi:MAG: MBL fold metallo-hydrolase [Vulcanisaeta sp. JCHS_4]|jgi:Predicted Zn-dependent hydrolases of the beta-lactamase fold|nr:MAG: MBL fold metallo-hydrolase [Vulcanisaeta sp. JCHS_4]